MRDVTTKLTDGEFTWRELSNGRIWVETPIPGSEEWLAAFLFMPQGPDLVLAEIRVIPDTGRIQWGTDRGESVTVGDVEWTVGPMGIVSGGGDWSRKPKAFNDPRFAGGLPVRILRDIPSTAVFERVQELLASRANAQDAEHPGPQPRRPGRAGRDDHFYAVWASRYVEEGWSVKTVAEKYGEQPKTVLNWIYEARHGRALLTETRQGRGGGTLTAKAKRLLRARKVSNSKGDQR